MSRQDCIEWWNAHYDHAAGTLGLLRHLPVPVPPALGRDERLMAGAVRSGSGVRREDAGRAGLRQGAVPALAANASR